MNYKEQGKYTKVFNEDTVKIAGKLIAELGDLMMSSNKKIIWLIYYDK